MIAEGVGAGDRWCAFHLGMAFLHGVGVREDAARAAELFAHGAQAGDLRAKAELAHAYWHGRGVRRNRPRAVKMYMEIARRRSPMSPFLRVERNIGLAYERGIGGRPRNVRRALEWYERAIEYEDVDALLDAGWILLNGAGVRRDLRRAVLYFARAARAGDVSGMYNLGIAYEESGDRPSAMRWLRRAAKLGHAKAPTDLQRLTSRAFSHVA